MKQHSNVIEGSLSEVVRSKIGASISEFGNAGTNSTVDEIYNELVNLRQRNRGLENRIKQVE